MTDACYSNAIDRDHDSGLRQTLCWPRSSASLFSTFSSFFLFQLRTMLFHLHSLFTSRALHASRLFLFVQLSFFSCPLSCLLVFYVLQSVPYVFFSEFSSPLPCFLSFHLITPNPVSPFTLPIFLKIFHLIRSQA